MRIKVYRRIRPVLMMGKKLRCKRRVSMMGKAQFSSISLCFTIWLVNINNSGATSNSYGKICFL